MPDPSYVVQEQGRKAGLEFHLQTAFYPPLPLYVRVAFVNAFESYWNGDVSLEDLPAMLHEDAGYVGELSDYMVYLDIQLARYVKTPAQGQEIESGSDAACSLAVRGWAEYWQRCWDMA